MSQPADQPADLAADLATALIAVGDDHLILGHRLSQWCGHAPMLEEDLSMPNMALDMLGQARNLYTYAGKLENKGRDEDDLAYLRTDREYKNCLLVERPNGDFAHTMLRQLYFAAFMELFWQAASASRDTTIRGFAEKAAKEVAYHVRHSGEWVIRLGDSTEESAQRMQDAVVALHGYTDELFGVTDAMSSCIDEQLLPDPRELRTNWNSTIEHIFKEARLVVPEIPFPQEGGRDGRHTEDFGHSLSELQYMQRTYPGLTW